jgi:hypothetical protein
LAIYSTSSATGITLTNFASQNPVTITPTGTLAPPGTFAVGIEGTGTFAWTIDNFGLISTPGSGALGIYLQGGGLVTNEAHGVIRANPTSGVGVIVYGGGSVTNQTSGTISGADGVFGNHGAAAVTNAGSIFGGYDAVFLLDSGAVFNQPGGTLNGATYGVKVRGTIASMVTNQGMIVGQTRGGVGISTGGTVSNAASGAIVGNVYGIDAYVYATTIINLGTVTTPGTVGVDLFAGGSVTNAASATVLGGDYGVKVIGTLTSTVTNYGLIEGETRAGVGIASGGTVSNAGSGVISGGAYGVEAYGNAAAVINLGTVTAQGVAGVVFFAGGAVSNAASATILGGVYGVAATNTTATVTNQGLIVGAAQQGVLFLDGGYVSNSGSGTIAGAYFGVQVDGVSASVTNFGSISSTAIFNGSTSFDAAGIDLADGGTVANGPTGDIRATWKGVEIGALTAEASGTLLNQGTIYASNSSGSTGTAVWIHGPGLISNASFGTITGGYFGVQVFGASGSVANFGSISSSAIFNESTTFDAAGVDLADGGTVTNGPTGDIRATWKGVEIGALTADVGGTVLNQGVIYASNSRGNTGAAVWIHGPGLISNATSGTISGGPYGIVAYYQTTVVNLGSIRGSEFAVSATPGFADRVVDAPGAIFSGIVLGGNDIGTSIASTLELASGTSVGTLNGLGSYFIQFEDVTIDSGASWTWVSDGIGAGYTITDAGTLTNTGSLGSSVTLGVGAVLTNASGGTIVGSGLAALSGPSGGTAIVVNAGLIDPATYGVYLPGGGSVTNARGGTIAGTAFGVKIGGGSGTVTNAGTIVGGIDLDGTGSNLLVLDPGGVVASATASSSASNMLELASGASVGTVTGLGLQFLNFGSLQFDTGGDWFVAGNTAGLAGQISGFAHGDTIELDGITATGSAYAAGVLTLTDITGFATLAITGDFHTGDFVVTNVAGGADVSLACFRAGTRILTDRGEAAVETLRVGDLVRTVLGGTTAPVIWIGRREVDCARHPAPRKVWPVRVAAGAFGPGRPGKALFLSPDHAIHVEQVLIPVKCLINGSTITQVPIDEVVYYHIELPQHDVVLAEGLHAESYLDTGDRRNFANGDGPMRMFPDFSARMWEAYGCARLVVTGPELDATRALVNSRAAATVQNAAVAKHAA